MPIGEFGATQGWTGHRASPGWYGLFGSNPTELASSNDFRASLFWTTGHTYEMTDYREWTNGYPSIKFRNTRSDGSGNPVDFSGTELQSVLSHEFHCSYPK